MDAVFVAELWGEPAKNISLSNEPVNYWTAEAKSVHPSIKVTNVQGYVIKTQQMSFQYPAPCFLKLCRNSCLKNWQIENMHVWCFSEKRERCLSVRVWLEGHWTESLPNTEKFLPGKGAKSGVKLKGSCVCLDRDVSNNLTSLFSWEFSICRCKKNTKFFQKNFSILWWLPIRQSVSYSQPQRTVIRFRPLRHQSHHYSSDLFKKVNIKKPH